jgi:hypothetical protein
MRAYSENEMNDATRSYLKEFGAAMLAYSVVLPISIVLIQANPHAPWRFPLALAPVVPAALAMWAYVRALGRMDELQRRIQLEALALACGGTGLLTFSYGFLEDVGFPHVSLIWVLPLLIALWGVGVAAASRKYN